MRLFNKKSILSVALAFALVACGGSEDKTDFSPGKINDTALSFTSASKVSVYENQRDVINVNINQNNLSVMYSLSGQDSPLFNIEGSSGIITFKIAPDYETKRSYSLLVNVEGSDNVKITQSLEISILDIDESLVDITSPVFISNAIISVKENQTTAFTLKAKDSESSLTYSIFGQDASSFNVDKTSGLVVFEVAPDFETKGTYNFTAKATDTAGNYIDQEIEITILDVDELIDDITAPIFSSTNRVSVYENQFAALTLVARDETSIVEYLITSKDANSFTVNKNTGRITFKTAPDFEVKKLYEFTAQAVDMAGNTATENITINVLDIEDESIPVQQGEIRVLDLAKLAQSQGKSPSEYLISEFNTKRPTNFVQEDKPIFTEYTYGKGPTVYSTNNWASQFDFTGVAWDSVAAGTLITKQHIMMAAHFARTAGSKVTFFAKDGTEVHRTITTVKTLGTTTANPTYNERVLDVAIAKLNEPVTDNIKVYPLMDSRKLDGSKIGTGLKNVPFIMTDQRGWAYLENIKSTNSYTEKGHTTDSFTIEWWSDLNATFMHQSPRGGDSGHPGFIYINGEMALLTTLTRDGYPDIGHPGKTLLGPFYGDYEMIDFLEEVIEDMKDIQ